MQDLGSLLKNLQKNEIFQRFYLTKDGYKRFFDEEDIRYFFKDFNIKYLREESMFRYGNEKKVIEFCVHKS